MNSERFRWVNVSDESALFFPTTLMVRAPVCFVDVADLGSLLLELLRKASLSFMCIVQGRLAERSEG
jgi:hypothetical protein